MLKLDDEEVLIDKIELVDEDKESKPAAATETASSEPEQSEENKDEAELGRVPTLTRKNTPMPGKGEALDVMADVAAHMNYYDDDDEIGEKPSAAKTDDASKSEAAGTEEEKKTEDSTTINEPESEETKSPAEKEVTVGDGAA